MVLPWLFVCWSSARECLTLGAAGCTPFMHIMPFAIYKSVCIKDTETHFSTCIAQRYVTIYGVNKKGLRSFWGDDNSYFHRPWASQLPLDNYRQVYSVFHDHFFLCSAVAGDGRWMRLNVDWGMPKEYAVITLVNYATLYVHVYLVPRCKAETVNRWSGADNGGHPTTALTIWAIGQWYSNYGEMVVVAAFRWRRRC